VKRDMDLIRDLLETIEVWSGEHHSGVGEGELEQTIAQRGYTRGPVRYHVRLLETGGLIDIVRAQPPDLRYWVLGLTWQGCELLALMRNDAVWNRAKAVLAEKGLEFALAFGSELLAGLVLQYIG